MRQQDRTGPHLHLGNPTSLRAATCLVNGLKLLGKEANERDRALVRDEYGKRHVTFL